MPDSSSNGELAQRLTALGTKADANSSSVDARHAIGVQVGPQNTQIFYNYRTGTWAEGAVPRPLVDVSGAVESPYRGLAAFDERDAPFFFGRESATQDVLERMSECLQGQSLLVVSGVSGAGKSSLVRAGVLPLIRGAGLASAAGSASWPYLVLTPGRAPLDKLAVHVASVAGADAASVRQSLAADPTRFALTAAQAALASPGGPPSDPDAGQRRLLLVVDQFEQVFTQCADEGERRAFIAALHAAATAGFGSEQTPAALVVLVMRQDFEGTCADYPQLQTAIQQRYFVAPMAPRQLRTAITEPAKKAGARVEDDLVDLLLREIQTRPPTSLPAEANPGYAVSTAGVLPLLSYALDKAWRHRTSEQLTVSDYEWTGGIDGAVAESAQRACDRLTPDQQTTARLVFTRLTTISSDGVDTAYRASRSELTTGRSDVETRDVYAVLESFVAERLLTLGEDTVEISHEALLTAWPQLRDWLVDTHSDRIVHTRLRAAATEWRRSDQDRSYLYTGSLLETANSAAARIAADPARHAPLGPTEQEFLRASRRNQLRRVRARRAFVAVLVVFVVVLATTTVLIQQARQTAAQQRDSAVSGQLTSESENPNTDPNTAKIDSLAAWGINPTPESRYAMLTAVTRPETLTSSSHDNSADVGSVAFSPDGKTLAAGTHVGAQLWNVATGRQITTPDVGGSVFSVVFSPDGKTLATGTRTGTRLWNVATGKQTATLNANSGDVLAVAFSPDGKTLATGSEANLGTDAATATVQLWDMASGKQAATFNIDTDSVSSLAFAPDGKTLAVGNNTDSGTNTGTQLWDVATESRMTTLNATIGSINSVAFSPDGKTLATTLNASSGPDVGTYVTQLWDVTSDKLVATLSADAGLVNSVAFAPDGETVATSTNNGTQLWNVTTDKRITTLNANTGSIGSVAFSPDGRTLATGTSTGETQLWDLAADEQTVTLDANADGVGSVAFSPDGKTIVTGSNNSVTDADTEEDAGGAQLWNLATGKQISDFNASPFGLPNSPPDPVASVAFAPDGKTVATGTGIATVLWDVATGSQIATLASGVVYNTLAFSPDSKSLAIGTGGSGTQLWDVATGRQVATLDANTGFVISIAFSPDGTILATVTSGATQLWNVTTGKQIYSVNYGPAFVNSITFSPDGKTVAVGTLNGTQLWDVTTASQVANLNANTGSVVAVAFSPDGRTLATATDNGTGTENGTGNGTQLWDVATRKQIATLNSDAGHVSSVAFSPNGKTLAIGTGSGAQLWDVHYLVDYWPRLCIQIGESLSPGVWARYVQQGTAYRPVCG